MAVDCKATLGELEKLLVNGFEFLELICQDTPAVSGEGKTLARLLLDFFQYDGKKMLYVVLWATSKEIENTKSEDVVFRESNVQTELMFGYFYAKKGLGYLGELLTPLITAIHKLSLSCQVDTLHPGSLEYKRYYDSIIEHLQFFVNRFVNLKSVPEEFQRVFRHMKKEMNNRFPTSEHQFIVLSLLFLRVIGPAILNPALLKMDMQITAHIQKALACCVKVLQNLANFGSPFENLPMSMFNEFLQRNRGPVQAFFLKLTEESAERLPQERPPTEEIIDKHAALAAIYQQLQGRCLVRVLKQSRIAMAKIEMEEFLALGNINWKPFRKRSDAEAWKVVDHCHFRCKVSAIVKSPVQKVFDFFKEYERSLTLWPNTVKAKVIRIHDEAHVDMMAQVKAPGFSFGGGLKEFNFCRYDKLEGKAEDFQRAVILAFNLDTPENPEENVRRANFKTTGLLIESVKDNKNWCWVHLIVSVEKKKDMSSTFEPLQYSVLENVRRECED